MAKQWKKIDDMTSEERDNFTGRHILRLFLMNGLWLLFVLNNVVCYVSLGNSSFDRYYFEIQV